MDTEATTNDQIKKICGALDATATPEEQFNISVEGMKIIFRAQIKNATRIDKFIQIYELAQELNVDCTIHDINNLVEHSLNMYKLSDEIIKSLNYKQFIVDKDKFVNPVDAYIPHADKVETPYLMIKCYVTWKCLAPLGERIERLYRLVQESIIGEKESDSDK